MSVRQTLLAGAATVLALVSAWHSGRHMWHLLGRERTVYAAYTPAEREHAPIAAATLPPDVFDFYAAYLARGDRVYYQVLPSGLSHATDLPTAVETVGRFYLLPAVQVADLAHATVVVSYM